MADYVKIEWSGYLDFPQTTYSGGSKNGDLISGVFDNQYIDIENIGAAEYAIDEGEPGFPTSPSFSFTMKNRLPSTGAELFPYEYLASLGRTSEYGGSSDSLGDLFIRVTIPNLGNKIIFIGLMESFEYSIREFEVTISCTDFMRLLKNSSAKMLKTFEFGSCRIRGQYATWNPTDSNITMERWTNGLINNNYDYFDFNGKINVLKTLSTLNGYSFKDFAKKKLIGLKNIDVRAAFPTGLSSFIDFNEDETLKHFGVGDSEKDYKAHISFVSFGSSGFLGLDPGKDQEYRYLHPAKYYTGFVQVGNSTILTRFSLNVYVRLIMKNYKSDEGFVSSVLDADLRIKILHSNNPPLNSSFDGKTGSVYTRGAFQKEETDLALIDYAKGDSVEIKIHDFRRKDDELDIISDGIFYSEYGEKVINLKENPAITKSVWIHGSRYILCDKPTEEGALKTINSDGSLIYRYNSAMNSIRCTERGFFNVPQTLLKNLNDYVLPRFMYYKDSSYTIFDTSLLMDKNNQYCYLADLKMYGWEDCTIPSAIQKAAFQISAYVYSNEEGKIVFHSRNLHENYLPDNILPPGGAFISDEDFSYTTGTKFGYGSASYEIEYGDILEINNLLSDATEKKIVDKNGIAKKKFVSPLSLEVQSYRSSDLGVPSSNESFSDETKRRTIRPSVEDGSIDFPLPNMFPLTPIEMATKYARSFVYPSRLFSIGLDPNLAFVNESFIKDEDNIIINDEFNNNIEDEFSSVDFGLRIGAYALVNVSLSIYKAYLVKRINYSISDLISISNSVNLELLLIGTFEGSFGFIRDTLSLEVLDEDGFNILDETA